MTTQSHSALALRRLSPRQVRLATTAANAGAALDNINTTPLPDGAQCFVTQNRVDYMLDKTSTATADGTETIAPAAGGPGRWFAISGSDAYRPKIVGARNATTTTLAAYTRTGNVILADANGAIGAIDAVTNIVGDDLFLKNPAAGADGGVYTLDALGSASAPFQMTRKAGYDLSDEVADGDLIEVAEGTANGDKTWRLTTDEVIVLNTTSLTFRLEVDPPDLASTAAGKGASLIGVQDAGAFTTATDVEAALAQLFQNALSVTMTLGAPGLYSFREVDASGDVGNTVANGGVLSSDTTPILRGDAAESQEISWATGNVDKIAVQVMLPQQVDGTVDIKIDLLVSSGATDAASFVVESGWDGNALVTDTADDAATKSASIHAIQATVLAADLPGSDIALLTLILTPPAHAADTIQLHGLRVSGKVDLAPS